MLNQKIKKQMRKYSCLLKKIMSVTKVNSKIYKSKTYKEVILDPLYLRQWKKVIKKEIQKFENYNTWKYDKLLAKRQAIGSKWVFKVKYYSDSFVVYYKTWVIIQRFLQIYGIDFNKIFSLTVRKKLLWIFFTIVYFLNLIVDQDDIVAIYLKSLLEDNNLSIFMKLPLKIETFRSIYASLVYRFLRSIYRLK